MTPLDRFNKLYITSTEICAELKTSRAAIAIWKTTNKLPDAIDISGSATIWEREKIAPYIKEIHLALNKRRKIEE
jgi:hypothetical protein